MNTISRILLADIVDYAGLFPPAELELDDAIRNYDEYRREPESWMLGRFICPAARLGELKPYVDELFSTGPALRLSVLGRGGGSSDEFLEGIRSDLAAAAEFGENYRDRCAIEAFEVRLPGDLSGEDEVRQLLERTANGLGEFGMDGLPVFFERTIHAERSHDLPAVLSGIAAHNTMHVRVSEKKNSTYSSGFKSRCGGVETDAYPSVDDLADTIYSACTAGVPMKFTAGLHHPLRHYNEQAGVVMHGFINVFVAGILADSLKIDSGRIREIVADESPESFSFSENRVSWKELSVSTEEIVAGRRRAVTSFGSCSFDEPREDLRRLGWL